MPLLLIPIALLFGLLALVVLIPVGLWWRLRASGRFERQYRLLVATNAVVAGVALIVFMIGALIADLFLDHTTAYALLGILVGGLLGFIAARMAKVESDGAGFSVRGSRLITGLIVAAIAARIALALYDFGTSFGQSDEVATLPEVWWRDRANLFALGGLVLGHQAGYFFMLRRRLQSLRREPVVIEG